MPECPAAEFAQSVPTPTIWNKKPKVDGICDACGGELVQRKDDAPETVLARLEEYHEMTEPLKGFYDKLGKLKVVEGQEDVSDTTSLVFAALED